MNQRRLIGLSVLTPALIAALQEAARSGAEEVVILTASEPPKFAAEVYAIRVENAGRKEEQRDQRRTLLDAAKRRQQSMRARGRR